VALAAQSRFEEHIGPERAAFNTRNALTNLDVDLLLVHSEDDERMPIDDTREVAPRCRRARLHVVDGLTHRRTARDLAVVEHVADFVS
jgi:pimeloyl-ACP methyl ester carboxylesterase